MNKKLLNMGMTAIMMVVSTTMYALNKVGGIYQISSDEDLVAFGKLVEQEIYDLRAELTADISYNGQPLGGTKTFRGIFDGKGHTITLNQERTEDEAGLFYATGQPSVIKNLTVDGTIITSGKYAGGFVACANSLFLNCVSKVNIVSTVSGDATHGGFAGHLTYNNSFCVYVNCVSAVTITSKTSTNCAGFIGWADGRAGGAAFINCITIADINLADVKGSNTFARNPSKYTLKNCYYINKVDSVSDGATQVTAKQMKNGEVLVMLPNPTDWIQGPDCPLPVQTGDALTMEICTPAQLVQFARRVYAGESTLNGKLTTDIDLTGFEWMPIGVKEAPYVGTFDGQNHAITGFNYTTGAENEGVFGFVVGATIKDFSIAGELVDEKGNCGTIGFACNSAHISGVLCKLNILSEKAKGHGGGIVGSLRGGEVYNCEYAGTFTIRDNGADSKGGIVGYANFGKITACVMSGKINTSVSGNIGGILGYVNNDPFQGVWNCLVTGTVEVPSQSGFKTVNAVVGNINSNTKKEVFGGNVWLASVCNYDGAKGTGGANSVDGDVTKVAKVADDALATGEACYYLNACNPADPVWYQTLGKDEKPSLQGEDVVYLVGRKKCDGYGYNYSNNDSGFTQDPHQIGEDGFCVVCGSLDQSEDGYYLIGTAKAFRWIAQKVNSGEMNNIKMRLTADIDLAGENWQPIGDDNHSFSGELDGGKHKISNMIVDVDGVPGGLFGTVVNFSANDLIIDATCSVTSTVYTGGLIGHGVSSGVQNLVNIGVLCDVTNNGTGGDSSAAGGIIGNSNGGALTNMIGCFTTGAIAAAKDVGQISGWTNVAGAKIIDCWSIAQVPDGCKFFRNGAAPAVSNCYSTAEPLPVGVTLLEYTEDMMASGELCYKLNGLQERIIWYQTLGEDEFPMPDNRHLPVWCFAGSYFNRDMFTVTFNSNGGSQIESMTQKYGSTITPPENPTKEGYTFIGWEPAIPETMSASDLTVVAQWQINSYNLIYIVDGVEYGRSEIEYGAGITPEKKLSKEGYTFSGWSEIPATMPAHDVTVTGSFSIISYTLTYMVDGEAYRTETVAYGTALTPEPALKKEGYMFTGWSPLPETMPAHDVVVTGNFYTYGDVNIDDEVDLLDVVDIARFTIGKPAETFMVNLADLNFDKAVNVTDAVVLINEIAGDQNFVKEMRMNGTDVSYDYRACALELLGGKDNTLSFCLNGEADFTAFQFTMDVPENASISDMRLNGMRKDGHQLMYNRTEDGSYRVVVLSLKNNVFKGNEGELLCICPDGLVSDEISIRDIHFVTAKGTDVVFEDLSPEGTITQIENLMSRTGTDDKIYDLQGRQRLTLQRGINIVNGKKVVIR